MSKYNSKKIIIDDYRFDSKVEWDYYLYLKWLWIRFELQPKYILQDKFKFWNENIRAIYYVADFSYWNTVIDIKWFPSSDAKLKRKLFMYKYPNLELQRLVRYRWERVNYFDNEKRKKANKRGKQSDLFLEKQ